jgi:hypothetical protein
MDYDFVFKKGQYKGKTVAWVEDNDPGYLVWVEECAPNLLEDPQEKKPKPPSEIIYKEPEIDHIETAIKPNLNFDNEGKNKKSE